MTTFCLVHTHITAIKACGLFKMAANQFNQSKVNGCSVLFLHFLFCYSRQERERSGIILRGKNKTKPNPEAWLADSTNTSP